MANVLVEESSLLAVANAIRSKTGGSEQYTPAQMGPAIANLTGGTDAVLIGKTVTAAGTYDPADDDADGYSSIVSEIPICVVPYDVDNSSGYCYNAKWMLGGATVNYSDMYTVQSGHIYVISFGAVTGSRFRALFTTEDTTTAAGEISGTWVNNTTSPAAYASVTWTAPADGYLTVTKDNAGTAGIPSYVFDVTPDS